LQFLRQKQGKNASLQKNAGRKERSELELLCAYRSKLLELGIEESQIEKFDLGNDFYWLFRLTALISLAYRTFEEVNRKYFEGRLERPNIIFCARSTGGYYNKGRHTIGISLPMTIEFGEPEFFETLLHEIAHIVVASHSPKFYNVLHAIGGSGKKAPLTLLLQAKRKLHAETHYPIVVRCPNCLRQSRYKTRRALHYACRRCCNKYAHGKYDERFKLSEP
jgi:predicted SprT family Zn-dependent metalloprotease